MMHKDIKILRVWENSFQHKKRNFVSPNSTNMTPFSSVFQLENTHYFTLCPSHQFILLSMLVCMNHKKAYYLLVGNLHVC